MGAVGKEECQSIPCDLENPRTKGSPSVVLGTAASGSLLEMQSSVAPSGFVG